MYEKEMILNHDIRKMSVYMGKNTMFFANFSVVIAPGSIICDECELIGEITIGEYNSLKFTCFSLN